MKAINLEEFLDWMVSLNMLHYPTKGGFGYTPTEKSHFYFCGSSERFSSKEIVQIWSNTANDSLNKRWLVTLADNAEHNRNQE